MINKDPKFQMAEKKLYEYFENQKKIEAIRNTNMTLSNQLKDIDKRLKNSDFFSLDVSFGGISYEEKVQTSVNTTSCQERALEKWVDRLEKEKEQIQERIFTNNKTIRTLEGNVSAMKIFVDSFKNIEKELILARYRDGLKGTELCNRLNFTACPCSTYKKKIIEKLMKFLEE